MPEPLQHLVAFVEGRLAPRELEQLLYHDAALQQLLQAERVPAGEGSPPEDVYTYVIQQDFGVPGGVLAVQELLSGCLQRRGVACQPTSRYQEHYDLLLRAQPEWLDLDLGWIEQSVLPDAGGKS